MPLSLREFGHPNRESNLEASLHRLRGGICTYSLTVLDCVKVGLSVAEQRTSERASRESEREEGGGKP